MQLGGFLQPAQSTGTTLDYHIPTVAIRPLPNADGGTLPPSPGLLTKLGHWPTADLRRFDESATAFETARCPLCSRPPKTVWGELSALNNLGSTPAGKAGDAEGSPERRIPKPQADGLTRELGPASSPQGPQPVETSGTALTALGPR